MPVGKRDRGMRRRRRKAAGGSNETGVVWIVWPAGFVAVAPAVVVVAAAAAALVLAPSLYSSPAVGRNRRLDQSGCARAAGREWRAPLRWARTPAAARIAVAGAR